MPLSLQSPWTRGMHFVFPTFPTHATTFSMQQMMFKIVTKKFEHMQTNTHKSSSKTSNFESFGIGLQDKIRTHSFSHPFFWMLLGVWQCCCCWRHPAMCWVTAKRPAWSRTVTWHLQVHWLLLLRQKKTSEPSLASATVAEVHENPGAQGSDFPSHQKQRMVLWLHKAQHLHLNHVFSWPQGVHSMDPGHEVHKLWMLFQLQKLDWGTKAHEWIAADHHAMLPSSVRRDKQQLQCHFECKPCPGDSTIWSPQEWFDHSHHMACPIKCSGDCRLLGETIHPWGCLCTNIPTTPLLPPQVIAPEATPAKDPTLPVLAGGSGSATTPTMALACIQGKDRDQAATCKIWGEHTKAGENTLKVLAPSLPSLSPIPAQSPTLATHTPIEEIIHPSSYPEKGANFPSCVVCSSDHKLETVHRGHAHMNASAHIAGSILVNQCWTWQSWFKCLTVLQQHHCSLPPPPPQGPVGCGFLMQLIAELKGVREHKQNSKQPLVFRVAAMTQKNSSLCFSKVQECGWWWLHLSSVHHTCWQLAPDQGVKGPSLQWSSPVRLPAPGSQVGHT